MASGRVWPALLGVVVSACGNGVPTFADDVAPIVYRNCTTCHRDGGPAPFPFASYEEVAARADLIADVVQRRAMPPWLPVDADVRYARDRRLSQEAIETLVAWAAAGAPEGDPASAPEPPVFAGGWALGEPDLVVAMEEAFHVPAAGPDRFRNFVVPIPVDGPRYVRAVEFDPGNFEVVHHAVMSVDPTSASRLADARDDGPGFEGMFAASSEVRSVTGFFLGWTPGRVPAENPEGFAWRIEPGTDLVIQLHLRPTGDPESVLARAAFYFTDRPPERAPMIVRLGDPALDIAPGVSDYTVADTFELPVDVDLYGLYPHAHYLGKEVTLRAALPSGEVRDLMTIPDWDFNWQDAYELETPLRLPRGTELRLRWVYDNSEANPRNPSHPPVRVTLGWTSSDEMSEMHLQVVPRDASDARVLTTALARKGMEDQLRAWQLLLSVDPDDPEAHFGLGTVYQSRGELARALDHYQRVVRAVPDHAQAHYNIGLILEARGQPRAAEDSYLRALEVTPLYPAALNNLGALALERGDLDDAEQRFRAALDVDPLHADALNNLGAVLRGRGDLEGAAAMFRRTVEARPDLPQGYFNLAVSLAMLGRTEDALTSFGQGTALDPGAVQAYAALAWILATHPDAEVRSPDDAVRLGEQAGRLTEARDPGVLDVLAAAYAAAGRFREAVGTSERAIQLANEAGETEFVAVAEARLERYREGRPWIDGGG